MKTYIATVKVKATGENIIIESDYKSKKHFIKDLRLNGYRVNPKFVYLKNEYAFQMENRR